MMPNGQLAYPLQAEWLETDGQGGFASGTVGGLRTRRYHALLCTATTPPTGRMVLVNGLEAWLETGSARFAISAQHYVPDVVYPDGQRNLVDFAPLPWPRWTYRSYDGLELTQEVIARHGRPEVLLRWRVRDGHGARLVVRPLLSGRDYHALHHENPAFDFMAHVAGAEVAWRPYPGVPGISAYGNGDYRHDPLWYRNFLYEHERERGLDFIEDLAAPGVFTWDMDGRDAVLVLRADLGEPEVRDGASSPVIYASQLIEAEAQRRRRFATPLAQAADAYVARRCSGRTIIAGYPWFTDWGRDVFIALRGFMGLPGGLDLARDILLAWAPAVLDGMLPNRFPDAGGRPEYNAVDASLWYVIAAYEFLQAAAASEDDARILDEAVAGIIAGYRSGTRFGIRMDEDGLIAAGVPGVQLTWMDARVGDRVITPRIGKPVEVQALWLNALRFASRQSRELAALYEQGVASFRARFWNEERGCLFDVIDADHVADRNDPSVRPNQVFAVGGLPFPLLDGARARGVVDVVERDLLTPLGLRSLARGEPGYRASYGGGPAARDGAYHQGTVWPWLIGPFVEAWLRVRGHDAAARRQAGRRFLEPLRAHLSLAGLGHVCEIADAEPPYTPRGCPFQAWSLGELLRATRLVEDDDAEAGCRNEWAEAAS